MGEYMKMLTTVKEQIYADRLNEAKEQLKMLLNCLNADFKKEMVAAEKDKARRAIVRLLPVLDDLKANKVTQQVIAVLHLEEAKLPAKWRPIAPVATDPFAGLTVTADDVVPATAPAATEDGAPRSNWLDDITIDVDENGEVTNVEEVQCGTTPAPAAAAPAAPAAAPAPEKPKRVRGNARKELSPLMLDDYIGQEKAKASLRISIKAAKKEERVLGHLLICSSYGLGKTTLANIIANEMDMPFFTVNATNLKDTKSLSLFFSKIKESCIIFIDEIHSLKNDVQTVLLSILTDFAVSYINEAGEEQTFELPPFTLIGATTQAGELLKPFINRFTILELVDYTEEEKEVIVRSKFAKLNYEITPDAVKDIAKRSRGVPRTIETYAKGIKDIALTQDAKLITKNLTEQYFTMYDIDEYGLNKNDRLVLQVLADASKPLALITLESKTGIQKEDLAYRYEPYLIKLGFIDKTERGRVITQKGLQYIRPDSNGAGDNAGAASTDGGADDGAAAAANDNTNDNASDNASRNDAE